MRVTIFEKYFNKTFLFKMEETSIFVRGGGTVWLNYFLSNNFKSIILKKINNDLQASFMFISMQPVCLI